MDTSTQNSGGLDRRNRSFRSSLATWQEQGQVSLLSEPPATVLLRLNVWHYLSETMAVSVQVSEPLEGHFYSVVLICALDYTMGDFRNSDNLVMCVWF